MKWRRFVITLLFVLVSSNCRGTTPAARSNSQESLPDLSGTWVLLRDEKNYFCDCLGGQLFSEKIRITQNAAGLRVQSRSKDAPPALELKFGDSRVYGGAVAEHVSWELDPTTHADTLVCLMESNAILNGAPGISRSVSRFWLDSNGLLIVQSKSSSFRNDQAQPNSSDVLVSAMTYERKRSFWFW